MSRNGNFRLHSPMMANSHMGTAYGPDAESSAEGDILYGLREDDANLRLGVSAYDLQGLREDDANLRLGVSAYDLQGLREDDANLRLGIVEGDTSHDGASGDAEGSAEGHRDQQLGVSAYDQPGMLVSNGRMGGMVEDHWNVRMGGLREDDANLRLGVSAYDELRGLREDDADVRMGVSAYDRLGVSAYDELRGLREDDANLRMGDADDLDGLREDDANLRLGTAWAEDSAGSAEDPTSRAGLGVSAYDLQGLREDDANLRLGISAYDLGDVDSLNAEAGAIEQMQGLADHEIGKGKGMKIRNVARNAARVAFQGAKSGTITSRSEADAFIVSKTKAAGERMKQILQTRLTKVDQVVADAIAKAMAEWGPKIDNVLSKKVSVHGLRMGYILRGLGDEDDDLGRSRKGFMKKMGPGRHIKIMKKVLHGAEEFPPEMLNATGFHERFPVTVDIAGLGRIQGSVHGAHVAGLFDFLKAGPSAEEYVGKLRVIADMWGRIKPRFDKLAPQAQASIKQNMAAADSSYEDYTNTVPAYIAEGFSGYQLHEGRWKRVLRWEAYLPTADKLVSQAEVLGTAYTPAKANADAIQNVTDRANAAGSETFLQKAAPVAGAIGAAGLLTALVLAIA